MTDTSCTHPGCCEPAVGGDQHVELCRRHWGWRCDICEQIEADEYETQEKLGVAVVKAAFDAGKRG